MPKVNRVEPSLAALRSHERLNLAPSVREIEWQEEPQNPPRWGLYGEKQNLTCVIEDWGSFFAVVLAGDRIVEEVDRADEALLYFLSRFDREPIQLIYATVGKFARASWVVFGNGRTFSWREPTHCDLFLRRRPGYRETRYFVSDDAELPDL